MNDNEIMDVIRKASRLADSHHCSPWSCGDRGDYAGGNPRYWDKAVKLADGLGYRMRHDRHPLESSRTNLGHTAGYVPLYFMAEQEPYHICVIPGLTPGTDFFVSVHELAHAVLHHPAQNMTDLLMKAERQGNQEDRGAEIACHLSGIAVCKSLGVPVHQGAICYLSDRVQAGRQYIQEKDQYAAFCAARVITEAMK